MIISWDTETTGLPTTDAYPNVNNLSKFSACHVVQLSAVKFDDDGRELDAFNVIIRPDTYSSMPEAAEKVHGVSFEKAREDGIPFGRAFRAFKTFCGNTTLLIAYNSQYDERMVLTELLRRGAHASHAKWFRAHKFICVYEMFKRTEVRRKGKLTEVYRTYFGEDFEGAHDALADSRAAARVYLHLKDAPPRKRDKIGVPLVTINASDIASALGRGYDDPRDVVAAYWIKYFPKTFKGSTRRARVYELASAHKAVKNMLRKIEYALVDDVDQLHRISARCDEIVDAALEDDDARDRVKKYARSCLSMNYGKSKRPLEQPKVLFYPITNICGTRYQIAGAPGDVRDGILFVVKHRTKSLHGEVRRVDEIQCRIYMEMTGCDRACLVEHYKDETRSYLIERCLNEWNDILIGVHNFIDFFHSLHS